MTHFMIAGLQLALAPSNNLDLVVKKIRTTMARFPYVQMIMLSELAICGASPTTAEALPSAAETKLCALAKEFGIWLIPGTLFETSQGNAYNTAPVINPEGEVVKRYRKMYPFYPFEKGVSAGDDICVFDVPNVGRFGLSICYDIWFPEHSRAIVTEGAEVILHPTLTNTQDREIECAIIRATAAQQQCYVIDVNGAGDMAWGKSQIVGPEGDIIHTATSTEEVMLVEVDLARVRRTRERGIMGLGQPLKSFRDAGHIYPQEGMANKGVFLDTMGALTLPARGE